MTTPDRTLSAAALAKRTDAAVINDALAVTEEYERLLRVRRGDEIPGDLRACLERLARSFERQDEAYRALDAAWQYEHSTWEGRDENAG